VPAVGRESFKFFEGKTCAKRTEDISVFWCYLSFIGFSPAGPRDPESSVSESSLFKLYLVDRISIWLASILYGTASGSKILCARDHFKILVSSFFVVDDILEKKTRTTRALAAFRFADFLLQSKAKRGCSAKLPPAEIASTSDSIRGCSTTKRRHRTCTE